VGQCLIWQY